MDPAATQYTRQVYSLLALISDIGGLFEIFVLIIGLVLVPLAEHAYYCNAISKLYVVEGQDTLRVNQTAGDCLDITDPMTGIQNQQYKPISLNVCQYVGYFIFNLTGL